jgi:hypothetical protein
MEAWILHIREEYQTESKTIQHYDKYNAWMNEKQAYKAAGKFLMEKTLLDYSGPFVDHQALRSAVRALVECDKIIEAVDLVNNHSEASPHKNSRSSSHKIHIEITQSTFLGSPFE